MANKTISDLEQIVDITGSVRFAVEGGTGDTSSMTLSQLLDFLHEPVQNLSVSGTAPNYTLNPAVNIIGKVDLSTLQSTDIVTVNLPAGFQTKEAQVILKVKNPNLATFRVQGLTKKLATLNLTIPNFQLILDYDQAQSAWAGGTLPVDNI